MSLADRMRQAADVLEEASKVYGVTNLEHHLWSPWHLRTEAEHVENSVDEEDDL